MAGTHDTQGGKKTIQINVRMNEQDHEMILRAAARLWPHAILTKSAIMLSLARMRAQQALSMAPK
jgi:uncharacterized protein (DUF1778 family)